LLHARADRTLRGVVSAHLEKYGVTRMEWLVLAAVCEGPPTGMCMGELARLLDVSLPQVTALVNKLVAQDLVQQQAAPQDRRARYVTRTAKGYRLIKKIETGMRGTLKEWLADIPMPQLEAYMRTIHALAYRRQQEN
jgi:DNA-binding MarR family transcriptional regulator